MSRRPKKQRIFGKRFFITQVEGVGRAITLGPFFWSRHLSGTAANLVKMIGGLQHFASGMAKGSLSQRVHRRNIVSLMGCNTIVSTLVTFLLVS